MKKASNPHPPKNIKRPKIPPSPPAPPSKRIIKEDINIFYINIFVKRLLKKYQNKRRKK